MSRRPHDRTEDHYGAPKPAAGDVTSLPLFGGEPAPSPNSALVSRSPTVERDAKATALRDARWRRWIDAGKPIALLVAAQDGQVTAETFRLAAEKLPHTLPPTYGEDRTLSYLSAMFRELVATGHLRKRRRADGSVVKVLSAEQRNEHVIYELAARQERAS